MFCLRMQAAQALMKYLEPGAAHRSAEQPLHLKVCRIPLKWYNAQRVSRLRFLMAIV